MPHINPSTIPPINSPGLLYHRYTPVKAVFATTIDFDTAGSQPVADGTAIDTLYQTQHASFAAVSPTGSAYARYVGAGVAYSGVNIASIVPAGHPQYFFDEQDGALQVSFHAPVRSVQIWAQGVAWADGQIFFGTSQAAPYMNVLDAAGNLLQPVLYPYRWSKSHPDPNFGKWASLAWTSGDWNIAYLLLSSSLPTSQDPGRVLAIFDSLSFTYK